MRDHLAFGRVDLLDEEDVRDALTDIITRFAHKRSSLQVDAYGDGSLGAGAIFDALSGFHLPIKQLFDQLVELEGIDDAEQILEELAEINGLEARDLLVIVSSEEETIEA